MEDQIDKNQTEEKNEQSVSFVDMLDQGGESHSPADAAEPQKQAKEPSDNPPSEEDSGKEDESPKPSQVTYSEEDYNALKDNLERTRKRLHDTQSRLHEVCTERSSLRRELDSLAEKNDGDWFSEEDTEKKDSLEKRLKESDEHLRELDEQSSKSSEDAAYESWEAATRPVRKAHPDFDQMVYGYLYGKIAPDSKDYDPAVRAMWDRAPAESKSATGIYDFAVGIREKMAYLDDPEAYKKKLREEIEKESNRGFASPVGGEGLDLVNGGTPSRRPSRQEDPDFVEALFK